MIDRESRRRMLPLAMLTTVVVLLSVSVCSFVVTEAQGKLCEACAHRVGSEVFYTHATNTCGGAPIDPINLVWYDPKTSSAFAETVASDFSAYSFDNWLEEQDQITDPQAVRDTTGKCINEKTEVSNAGPFDAIQGSRGHARLFDTYNEQDRIPYVVGDAHVDQTSTKCGSPAGHYSVDFLVVKRVIYKFWHSPKHFDFWGNTRSIKQCNGHEPSQSSNGWTAVMEGYPSP